MPIKIFLKIGFSAIFLCLTSLIQAQIIETREQTALNLESQAGRAFQDWNGSSMRRSVDLYRQAAEIWKEINDPRKASECFRRIAQAENLLGNNEAAFAEVKTALEIDQTSGNIDGKIKSLSSLSRLYLKIGNKKESKILIDEALALSSQTQDQISNATASSSAAEYYYFERDFSNASQFYEQSLNFWAKTDNIGGNAQTLVDYGYFLMAINDPLSALNALYLAYAKFQEIEDRRGMSVTRIALGNIYSTIDEKQSALNAYRLAEAGFPEDMDFIEKARLHNGMGNIYEDFQEWDLSLAQREEALLLFKKDNYPQGQLATLPSLVKLSYVTGNEQNASNYYSELQAVAKKLKDTFFIAITYKQIGDYYFEKQTDDEAVEYYRKTLEVLKKFESKIDRALIENNLGTIYQRRNQYDTAQAYYDSALKTSRETSDKFAEANVLYNISRQNLLKNEYDQALEAIRASIKITEEISSNFNNSKLTRTYFADAYKRYEFYIGLLMKLHKQFPGKNFEKEALQANEKSRSRSMLEKLRLTMSGVIKDADPKIIQQEREIGSLLNVKAEMLTQNLQTNGSEAETSKLNAEILNLTNQLEATEALLKEQSPLYSVIKNPPEFQVSEFQKNILDENTLLLEFSFGEEASYVWAVSKNNLTVFILPDRQTLNDQIDRLRQLLLPPESEDNEEIQNYQKKKAEAEAEYWKRAQILSNQLFGALAGQIGEKKLIIVPDGKLHFFPILALPTPGDENDFTVNKPFLLKNEIVYEPSATTLNFIKTHTPANTPSKDFLVLADPVFSKNDSRFSQAEESKINKIYPTETKTIWSNFRSMNALNSLERLEASGSEPDTILQNFKAEKTMVISGFSANRETFLETNVADYKVIHLATHGLLNEEKPELSGIVLSQYDKQGNKRDGLIWLQDIYNLDLATDLVVLSACDTGIGKEIKGEGLMSLTNGFLQSGAKTVIASQWKIDDFASLELMSYFYKSLANERVTPSQALRTAQINMYQKSRSPIDWAAFTVYGDFQNRPRLSTRFNYTGYLLIILVIFALFGTYTGYKYLLKR
ncbi:MAG: CHAT domain-containing protein [Pyrinomonadaceae bacterium]|nr:CHAT domain-containing protein [Pyrinomonadaceae bacterium]